MRVPEYFTFDPQGDYLKPRLQGFRLENGVYVRIEPDDMGRVRSETLGLDLATYGDYMRFYKRGHRTPLLDHKEWLEYAHVEIERANLATRLAESERQRADLSARFTAYLNEETARLRAEIEALRKQSGA